MLRKLSWVLALLALCSISVVYPLGLGAINLHSGLNQPLSADIELRAASVRDASSIEVRLGSDRDFASAGLHRSQILDQLRFTVEPRGQQGYVIHVSTEEPIREPLLEFLIQVTWQGGQLLREYTVPINPPVLTAAPEAVPPQSFGAPLSDTDLAAVQQQESPQPPTTTAETSPSPQTTPPAEVKPEVATRSVATAEPSITTKPKVMEKPAAAVKSEATRKPAVVAKREVKPKPTVPKLAIVAGNRTQYGPVRRGETLSGIASRALPDRSTNINQKMQAILQANPDAFIDNNINNLKTGRILRLPSKTQISAIDPQQALLDTQAQTEAWRRQQGIAVAAAQPAVTQATPTPANTQQAATEKPAPKPAAVTPAPQIAAVPSGQAELKLAPPPHEGAQTEKSGMGTGTEGESRPDSEAIAAQQLEAKDLNARLAALEHQLATMQKLMAIKDQQLAAIQAQNAAANGSLKNPDTLLAIIGVLAAGLVAMLLITMRKPQSATPDLLRDAAYPGYAPTANAPPTAPRVAATVANRKPQAPPPAAYADNEPIADTGINSEIDVYIAYGRYQQAVDLIKEIMVHDHSDELKLKLLEVYYATRNVTAFEETASNIREHVSADTALWRKIIPMGRELCPKSSLFT